MEDFFELIRDKKFVFWVCPNGCKDMVVWNADKTNAVCSKCGLDSSYSQNGGASD